MHFLVDALSLAIHKNTSSSAHILTDTPAPAPALGEFPHCPRMCVSGRAFKEVWISNKIRS